MNFRFKDEQLSRTDRARDAPSRLTASDTGAFIRMPTLHSPQVYSGAGGANRFIWPTIKRPVARILLKP